MRVLLLLLLALPVFAETVITDTETGETVTVPNGYEVRIVKEGTPTHLLSVELIPLELPEDFAPDCVNPEDGPFFSPQPPPCSD